MGGKSVRSTKCALIPADLAWHSATLSPNYPRVRGLSEVLPARNASERPRSEARHRRRPGATSQGYSEEVQFPRWGWGWEGAPGETPKA